MATALHQGSPQHRRRGEDRYRARVTPARRRLVAALALLTVVAVPAAPAESLPGAGPDDPAVTDGLQWNLDLVSAPGAWPYGTGDGVTVAVVDSGVDAGHEDLSGAVVTSVDCVGARGDAENCIAEPGPGAGPAPGDDGHGTHVAGLIAARAGNGRGVAGVAPRATLQSVRVLRSGCVRPPCAPQGNVADVVAGINWAITHDADVINLSLGITGGRFGGPTASEAITRAWEAGIIVVVAAGNEGLPTTIGDQPAIVVTAVDRDRHQPGYAQDVGAARWRLAAPGGRRGDTVESCRPGGDPVGLISTYEAAGAEQGTYGCLAGTSMAAPQVSGAAAVLRSAGYSPTETVQRLLAGATDLGPPGPDTTFGAGLVDVERSVSAELEGVGPVRAEAHPVNPLVPASEPEPIPWPLVAAGGGLVAFTATITIGGLGRWWRSLRAARGRHG